MLGLQSYQHWPGSCRPDCTRRPKSTLMIGQYRSRHIVPPAATRPGPCFDSVPRLARMVKTTSGSRVVYRGKLVQLAALKPELLTSLLAVHSLAPSNKATTTASPALLQRSILARQRCSEVRQTVDCIRLYRPSPLHCFRRAPFPSTAVHALAPAGALIFASPASRQGSALAQRRCFQALQTVPSIGPVGSSLSHVTLRASPTSSSPSSSRNRTPDLWPPVLTRVPLLQLRRGTSGFARQS